MKKIFQYISALLLLLVVGSSCEEGNDNWTIITAVQQGNYIAGDATIYSAVATSSSLIASPLDNAPEGANVVGIYTWLKAGAGFTIMKVDAEGNPVNYGKGAVVASTPFETVALAADAAAFTVAKDGLYYVALNNADNQLTILPAEFGIIGDATPGKWDAETVMSQTYDERKATVEMRLKDVTLDNKQIKFRYAKTWGVKIPYGSGDVTIHSNMGNTSDPKAILALTEAYVGCKGGGENFSLSKKGLYDVTLKLDLRTGNFSAQAICTGEDTSSAELPKHLFMTGSPYGWDWTGDPELIPVHSHEGMFWGIYHFDKDAMVKFNSSQKWDGNEFGVENEDPRGYGEYESGGANLKIGTAGYYLVKITCTLSPDKKTVLKKVTLSEPAVYLIGITASGSADDYSVKPENKFTFVEADDEFVSPKFKVNTTNNAGVRMCVKLDGADWWQTEFNVYDGKIVYRGVGGDQTLVQGIKDQQVHLNLKNGNASIK